VLAQYHVDQCTVVDLHTGVRITLTPNSTRTVAVLTRNTTKPASSTTAPHAVQRNMLFDCTNGIFRQTDRTHKKGDVLEHI